MHSLDERPCPRLGSPARARAVWLCAAVVLWLGGPAEAQERPLRLEGFMPGGLRVSVTESWGIFEFDVTNLSDQDRHGRVLMFFDGRPDVQYGRDVWIPARATIKSWLLAGPPGVEHRPDACEIEVHLYDHSEGKPRLILPRNEQQILTRSALYKKPEPYTSLLLDEWKPDPPAMGALPQPESRADEATHLARVARASSELSEFVHPVNPGALPVTAEALDGCDQFIIASNRIANDPAGMEALRHWLQRGGHVWVMLDLVDPEVVAPLLGDRLDFQMVDRVSLTTTKIEGPADRPKLVDEPAQEHERPVAMARVLLPPREQAPYSVDGWPAWFTRPVGRGKVLFTTLGPRAWYRPRTARDPKSPYTYYEKLPVPTPPLDAFARELQPPKGEEQRLPLDAMRPLLADEIGYSVVHRRAVLLVFGSALLVALGLGIVLRKAHRPEWLGWLGPVAALGAAAIFLLLGESSRRAAPATVVMAQIVDADTGVAEAPVQGLLAVYRPESGPVEAGVRHGGLFDLDMEGVEGQTRGLMSTDLDSWHWDNLSLPAGVRFAPFRSTIRTGEPIKAIGRFGPEGLQGKLTLGNFHELDDAILSTPNGRNLAVRLNPDGTFQAGGRDALPSGLFLAGAVLNDKQQRRQEVYREFLKRPTTGRMETRAILLAWANPLDIQFDLVPGARTAGSALLVVPVRMESPAPGERVTIPGSLIPYRQMLPTGPIRPTVESTKASDMHLRFQLPPSVLPFTVEGAKLTVKMSAPSRRVTISGRADGGGVELHRVDSPLDPIRVDINDERFLHLNDHGGLHLNLAVSDLAKSGGAAANDVRIDEKWSIEFVELEVVGKMGPER